MSDAARPVAPHVVVGMCIPSAGLAQVFERAVDVLAGLAVTLARGPASCEALLVHEAAGPVLLKVRDNTHAMLELSFSGDLLTLPDDARFEPAEAVRRGAIARLIREALEVLVQALEPLYGAIDVDRPIPAPSELPTARIGPDLYLGSQLLAADTSLEADLHSLFPGLWTEQWGAARLLLGWRSLRTDGGAAAVTLRAAETAARRLARAVNAASGCRRRFGGTDPERP